MFTISKIKLNQRQVLIGVVLAMIAVAFYWFQVRPAHISKLCSNKAWYKINDDVYYYDDYQAYFTICQHQHGL